MARQRSRFSEFDDLSVEELAEVLAVDVAYEDTDPGERHEPEIRRWKPRLNPTQELAFNDSSDVVALYSEKFSGKSLTAEHCITRHLYSEWNAFFIVLGNNMAALKEGVGEDMTTLVLPTWSEGNREPPYIYDSFGILVPNPKAGQLMDEGLGLEWEPWKMDPVSKNLYMRVRNRFGGWSRIRMMAVPFGKQVEARIKGPAPSGVYLEEATDVDGKEYYTYPAMQLYRRRDIVGPQQFFLSCNPKKPSWVYDWLWGDCKVPKAEGREWPKDRIEPGIVRDKSIAVYYIPYSENRHNVNQKNREILEATLRNNTAMRDRLIGGLWTEVPSGDALFKDSFKEADHIHGKKLKGSGSGYYGITPLNTHPIIIGYDTGQVHVGISFLQCIETADGPFWIVFDELCFYGKKVKTQRLTRGLLVKMSYWCRRMNHTFDFIHVADEEAVSAFKPESGSTTAREIQDEAKEMIKLPQFSMLKAPRLSGCPKPPGSKAKRGELVAGLLDDQMLAVSSACDWHRQMFMHLIQDPDKPMEAVRGKYIHTYDSMSYPIYYRRFVRKNGFSVSDDSAVEVTTR